jgi:hypothetical protein
MRASSVFAIVNSPVLQSRVRGRSLRPVALPMAFGTAPKSRQHAAATSDFR